MLSSYNLNIVIAFRFDKGLTVNYGIRLVQTSFSATDCLSKTSTRCKVNYQFLISGLFPPTFEIFECFFTIQDQEREIERERERVPTEISTFFRSSYNRDSAKRFLAQVLTEQEPKGSKALTWVQSPNI